MSKKNIFKSKKKAVFYDRMKNETNRRGEKREKYS